MKFYKLQQDLTFITETQKLKMKAGRLICFSDYFKLAVLISDGTEKTQFIKADKNFLKGLLYRNLTVLEEKELNKIKPHLKKEHFGGDLPENWSYKKQCYFKRLNLYNKVGDGTTTTIKLNEKMENQVLDYSYRKGVVEIRPNHPMVQNWSFTEETEDQAVLANSLAVVAEKNGLSANDLSHLFPAILRMLKDNSNWSK